MNKLQPAGAVLWLCQPALLYIISTAPFGNNTGIATANDSYAGQENVTQGGINLSFFAAAVTAAFD